MIHFSEFSTASWPYCMMHSAIHSKTLAKDVLMQHFILWQKRLDFCGGKDTMKIFNIQKLVNF